MSSEDEAPIPQLERPSEATILEWWTSFFADPLLSYPHLKQAAISGAVASRGLRSLHWRVSARPHDSLSIAQAYRTCSRAVLLLALALAINSHLFYHLHLRPHPYSQPF